MAKLAVIFLLFALFAITMGASVPQEESNAPKVIVDAVNQGVENFNKFIKDNINEENLKKWQDGADNIGKSVADALQNVQKEVEKTLKQAIHKPIA
ncbi:neuropeptide-like 2 [Drosophila bipectinata]|uniref:neuropeptide-like 2 n=1 Tax=Drosophila bipectinata TaxID=42026 RepID=UPI0038B24FBC